MKAAPSSPPPVLNASLAKGRIWAFLAAWALAGAAQAAPPNFGPNVLIFDPSMSASAIQSQLDTVFTQQQSNQFGTQRYALLFKPGSYTVNVHVGFYTQVLGLGLNPDDTTITGVVQVDAAWNTSGTNANATENFWRSAENLAVVPTGGTDMWAVSQACPMRRVHMKGGIVLDDNGGWSSGGFLSDCLIDGQIDSGTQQQWLSRNCQWKNWIGQNWNMVFVGDVNAPTGAFPYPPYTAVGHTPVSREKPYLTVDGSGNYSVFVPFLAWNSQGTTWAGGATPGQSIPLTQFYIAQQGVDTAETINTALAQGLNLLLTPGIYSLDEPINVTRPNTIILGLGLATLDPQNGVGAMTMSDVDGVLVGGLLFEAGATPSPVLLQVGPPNSSLDHSANPTILYDLYFRIGGAFAGQAASSLQINSGNVIGDDFWVWRADHGSGVGWTINPAANGLIVNGNDVTIYGLAVEHYQQYQTLWNGNGGHVFFYQSEAPYDVPSDSSWMDGSVDGFASYKVADTVTSHDAWGLGVYCFFNTNSAVILNSAIETPTGTGIQFVDMTTVSLGGVGEIANIINSTGPSADSSTSLAQLVRYPAGGESGDPTAPSVLQQPSSQTVTSGTTVVFGSPASGNPAPTYQWSLNGVAIPGGTGPLLVISGATSADAGSYTCKVTNSYGSITTTPAELSLVATNNPGRLINISARAFVGTGGDVLIAGYVIEGSGQLPVLLRSSGPALIPQGVSGVLPDPQLQLYSGQTMVDSNAGWGGNAQIISVASAVGAYPWPSASSKDSALLENQNGAYTGITSGVSGDTGVALAEVYDATPGGTTPTARLANISARAFVGTGGNVLIAGFVIGGTTSKTVLIRASGPALVPQGVSGVLPDPQLQLYSGQTVIASNIGWGGNSSIVAAASQVGAYTWPTPSSSDSAILITLPPGAYTAIVSGVSGDSGIALAEVYDVP